MSDVSAKKALIRNLWSLGLHKQARAEYRSALSGMDQKTQGQQMKIFRSVLSDMGADSVVESLRLNPQKKTMSFKLNLGLTEFSPFLERFLRNLNASGTKEYSVSGIHRGDNTIVEIKIG
jgi:hypothetical protein